MEEWCDNGELRRVEMWNYGMNLNVKRNAMLFSILNFVLYFDFLLILKGIAIENGIEYGKKWIIEL